jgi:large subunit ribosomal protein L19e
MNLKSKKELAARTLNVGVNRIKFVESRIDEIKEALTKQDIKDLYNDKAIIIKEIKGKRKKEKKKKRRTAGNIRKKVNKRKQEYVKLARKLRSYLKNIKNKLPKKDVDEIRKKIRNRYFKSKSDLKNYIAGVKK